KDIRIFNMQPWLEDVYRAGLKLYEDFFDRCGGIVIWADVLDAVLAFLRNGAAYAVLIAMALTDGLSASEFLLYFAAVGGFSTMVTGIVSGLLNLHKQSMDLSAAREFLETPEPFQFEDGVPLSADLNEAYELTLKDVSFRYPGAEQDVLTHVDLTIHPGEKLAVVGLNGAGKTTLVKLLCGLYDPTEGQVLLNGTDIRVYNRRDYYKLFSAVFQRFSILGTSVRENITQTVEACDEERLNACVEKAGLTEKLHSLTNGLDSHVTRYIYDDGIELSGGETQRLMLARALYKNGPILILDEPTAALDPIAENDIYMKYSAMTKGRTSVFISHRLASTRFCDRIVFVADGTIAEEGTHESLLAQNGQYAALFEVQAHYYREEMTKHG
ncbi:MAG: ABC transporter ATP-binding protein, partial [Clostridia bacterium]|nr:ABC transporter ATP-binding protein [Clostridia bacterium]